MIHKFFLFFSSEKGFLYWKNHEFFFFLIILFNCFFYFIFCFDLFYAIKVPIFMQFFNLYFFMLFYLTIPKIRPISLRTECVSLLK